MSQQPDLSTCPSKLRGAHAVRSDLGCLLDFGIVANLTTVMNRSTQQQAEWSRSRVSLRIQLHKLTISV